MSFGEILARWALVIGFGLLGFVTGLAALMITITPQPGNVPTLGARGAPGAHVNNCGGSLNGIVLLYVPALLLKPRFKLCQCRAVILP